MKQYEVGQILYMASDKSFKIIPVQIVEEVIRTTINGKEKTYMLMFPDKEKTVVDITKVSANLLFKDEKSIKDYMIENTKKAISALVNDANKVKAAVFASEKSKNSLESKDNKDIVQEKDDDVIIKVDLGNGQTGRINKKNLNKVKNK